MLFCSCLITFLIDNSCSLPTHNNFDHCFQVSRLSSTFNPFLASSPFIPPENSRRYKMETLTRIIEQNKPVTEYQIVGGGRSMTMHFDV